MRTALGVEVSAFGAAIIHLGSEPICEDRAQDKDAPKHCDRQESIAKTLHLFPAADRPLIVIL